MDTLQFDDMHERGEWREMVRLFLGQGMTGGQALALADGYIIALRDRSKKLDALASR